jgi:tetratricopeptide (TPR) repeat protein
MIPRFLNTLSTIAEFLECQRRFAGVEGFLADLEGYTLLHLAADGPGLGAIVEIGSFLGRSTAFLAAGSKSTGREKVTAVDHFQGSPEHQPGQPYANAALAQEGTTFRRFQDNLKRLGLDDHVTPILASSPDAARQWQGPIRLLFIDGDHSYELSRQDFELWSAFVVPHGLICFHDIPGWQGVTRFYQELMSSTAAYREVATVLSMKIVQKVAPAVSPSGDLGKGAGICENNRGVQLLAQRRYAEAEAAFRHALALEPALPPEVHYNLAKTLQNQEKFAEAEGLYRYVLQHRPTWADCHFCIANLFFSQRRLAEAEAAYRRTVELQPDHVEALNSLGANVLNYAGRTDEAQDVFRQALAVQPDHAGCHSNLLLNEQYRPTVTLAGLAEAHNAWERRHAAPLRGTWRPFDQSRDPDRPLRIGFVSGDFRLHPVGLFLAPVLERLKAPVWFTACYANQRTVDEQTQRLSRAAGLWRNVANLTFFWHG